MSSRNPLFDNIKALMLFLVALGHTLEVYKNDGDFELNLMKYIYLFHMPVFSFVTGFFTKNTEKARATAAKKILIPYLVIQGSYILAAYLCLKLGIASFNQSVFNYSLLLPSSAFYYLLAVFFWKEWSPNLLKLKHPILITVLIGTLVSTTKQYEFHRGLGAVFTLLPFFVMGLLCDEKNIRRICNIPKWISAGILFTAIFPAVYLPYAIHSVRMTYTSVGFGLVEGISYRLLFYAIASLLTISIINLTPRKNLFISRIGKSAILVYAISTFFAPHAYILIAKYFSLQQNRYVNFVCMLLFCFLLVTLASAPVFERLYRRIMQTITRSIFKENANEKECLPPESKGTTL